MRMSTDELKRLSALAATMRGLYQDVEFYDGITHAQLLLPDQILMFHRSRTELDRGYRVGARHHRFVLIVAMDGAANVCTDDRPVLLSPGQALLVHPYQYHWYAGFRTDEVSWLFVTFESVAQEHLVALRDTPVVLVPSVVSWLLQLVEIWKQRAARSRGNEMTLLLGLVLHGLLQAPSVQCPQPDTEDEDAAMHTLIERINAYALNRLPQAVGVKQLARHLGMSESHLRFRFRDQLQISLGCYLREVRLYRARALLYQKSMNVTEIAEACGFGSVAAFSRAFKKAFGASPRRFHPGDEQGRA